MKKIMGIMALLVFALTACQKENESELLSDQLISESSLQASPGDPSNDPDVNELRKKHRRDTSFRKIATDQLLQSILDYVAANYPGGAIELAFTNNSGNFFTLIRLADGKLVLVQFDANGTFIKELDRKVKPPKKHRKLKPYDPANLLVSITDYVDANYAGATIEHAAVTRTGEFVVILNFNGARKALLFDANGVFLKELR